MIFEILFKTLKGISVKEAYKNFNGFLGLIGYFGYFFADFGLSFLDFRIFWTTGVSQTQFYACKVSKEKCTRVSAGLANPMYRPCGYARNLRPSVFRELTPVLKQVNSEVVTKKH